jgi:hypothetical protein
LEAIGAMAFWYIRPLFVRTLTYCWLRQDLSIFSPQTILPFKEPLNKLMRKLFSVHIVGFVFKPLLAVTRI